MSSVRSTAVPPVLMLAMCFLTRDGPLLLFYKVGPSPQWLRTKIESVGMRSIVSAYPRPEAAATMNRMLPVIEAAQPRNVFDARRHPASQQGRSTHRRYRSLISDKTGARR